jgi:tripartite motif-containing protein 2/3
VNLNEKLQVFKQIGSQGKQDDQLNLPTGFCLDSNDDIVIADTNNDKIKIFNKDGKFKWMFGINGEKEGQLVFPRKVALFKNKNFVVSDWGKVRTRIQVFDSRGKYLNGVKLECIDILAGLCVSDENEIVAIESVSPTVYIFDGDSLDLPKHYFNCSQHIREPSDIAVKGNNIFICDYKGHNVKSFNKNGDYLRTFGGEDITPFPSGIDINDEGDIYVGNSHSNQFHITIFESKNNNVRVLKCSEVKVSRCCGLKITNSNFIVTLAKKNHHALILNGI